MSAALSTLDDTWAAWIAGRAEDAIRACVAMIEADDGQVGAAALLARALHGQGHPAPDALVDVFVRRGDLPTALSLAALVEHPDRARATIAEAFGKGSPRVADVAPAPPPLPGGPEVKADLAKLSGAKLIERAKTALAAAATDLPADAPVPELPLFGALPKAQLEQLLGAWEARPFEAGATLVHEGDEGKEAFLLVRGHLGVERGATPERRKVLAELGPGSLFGEMALVSDAPRAASVRARDSVLVLVASRDELEKLAKKTKSIGEMLSSFCRSRMISNLLRHGAILGAVAPEDRQKLMNRFEARRFKAGESLVTAGEQIEGLFLIASGAVQVLGKDADGDALELARLGPGDVVGEISLVLRRPATADVVATHQTVALELTREQFQSAIKEHPELLSELYELATKREEETRTVVAQETLDVEDVVLL